MRLHPSFRRPRSLALQLGVVAAILLLLAGLVTTGRDNIVAQGIASGFGFLERTTGWPVNFSVIKVDARSTYSRVLLAGLFNTVLVGSLALVLATILGVALGLMRISSNLILNVIGTVYVEIFRNVPIILQAFFWYAVLTHLPSPRQAHILLDAVVLSNRGVMLPALALSGADLAILGASMTAFAFIAWRLPLSGPRAWALGFLLAAGIVAVLVLAGSDADAPILSVPELRGLRFVGGVTLKPEFTALLVAIALFGAAYIGEIVRGGLLSVDRGRIEAGHALGLTNWQVNRLIRLPLALRAMLPALSNQYVWLMKATTIGIAIGYPDYFAIISTSINQSGQTLELLALLMGGFLLINYTIGFVMNRLNARLRVVERQ